ncbi:plasmid transfer protein TraA [Streptomyces sp. AN091965]|uniref:plasmid transfer protein TraA n=1 Tax=Streptomyces sp. AN091965 TaxID=2927803 RepID=UPI001F61D523|nr:plasmid transfer protein TraA [Streptomyces sp. AN091965]MCI3930268.1 sporulation protein SsgA [Streptomyces sp. AN091965]
MVTPTRNGAAGANKGNKFANGAQAAGAAAGGFVGAMGGSFMPSININVNRPSQHRGGGGQQGLLPPPEFSSPAQVRNYCNTLRAAGVMLSMEVAMAAEIMQSILAAVPDPEGRVLGSRMRAAKVSRKMKRSANALRDAAKNAAACYAVFQQEYQEEINRVRHRARKPKTPPMNWAQQ